MRIMKLMSLQITILSAFFLTLSNALNAQLSPNSGGYKLFPRDLVVMSILGEPDMTLERRIDGDGKISLPLIGPVLIKGLSLTEAESTIQQLYIDSQVYIRPQVSLSIKEYYPKEISVLGQVRNPGRIAFAIEASTINIVEAITKAGGFTRISKSDNVLVNRRLPSGEEKSYIVNVAAIIEGKGSSESANILPGDVIFVPERIF